jgi:prevent-host-death family protein
VPTIPQRELRNDVSAVLRAAEAGASYTITVGGRPVAELGPLRTRRWVARDEVETLLATPTDEDLLTDLAEHDLAAGLASDPWSAG